MPFNTCVSCGCNLQFHVSDFILNGNWKDGCQNIKDGKRCTCDEFSPKLKELLTCIVLNPKKYYH